MPAEFLGGFTVLMAVYGGDDPVLFERALESIYENTLKPNKVLLVVDGPVGSQIENIIQTYVSSRDLDVIRIQKNSGLATALNLGIENIKTEWTVRADSDDYNLPDRFETLAKEVLGTGSEIKLIGSYIEEVDLNGEHIAYRRTAIENDSIRKFAIRRNPFNHMSVAFRTRDVKAIGGYPELYLKEDYGLWIKMIYHEFEMRNISKVLVKATTGKDMYRRRGGLRYVKSEIDLQKFLVKYAIKSFPLAIVHGLMRCAVFMLPASIRGYIYMRLLRG